MNIAFTIKKGNNDGEYLRECNPDYQKELQAMANEIALIKKSVTGR